MEEAREPSLSLSNNSSPQRPSTSTRPNKQSGSSSRFKGVVYHQNGHWGAQIYAKHHRIWLGTFKTETAAATAYDSASIKLRQGSTGDAYHRNFPLTAVTVHEPNFQANYTTEQVLNMIKDGSYQTKFDEYLYFMSQLSNPSRNNPNHNNSQSNMHSCQELFRKELTPSDVGKLNRLVIPKRHALKYFPIRDKYGADNNLDGEGEEGGSGGGGGDLELIFHDKKMKSWKFRYCYWKSSQSFVFTRGWNKFVRVKNLKANDIVIFYKYDLRETNNNNNINNNSVDNSKTFWMIDVVNKNDDDGNNGKTLSVEGESSNVKKDKGLRLFGVQVVPPANSSSDDEHTTN